MPLRSVLTTSNANGSGTASTSVYTLTGTEQVGDVVVLASLQATSTSQSMTGFGGCTVRSGPDQGSTTYRAYLLTKTLTSGDISAGSITLTWNGSARMIDVGECFYGVDETNIQVAATTPQTVSATSITTPGVTTPAANFECIEVMLGRVGSGTPPTPTFVGTYTRDVVSKTTNASGANLVGSMAHLTTPGAAGSYGNDTVTFTSANPTGAYTLALEPTASGFTGTVTLAGSGSLSIGGSPATADAVNLSGSGSLSMGGAPAIPGTASLSGSGTLAINQTAMAEAGTVALGGSGQLAINSTNVAASGTIGLTGTGTLTIGSSTNGAGTISLSGSGALNVFPTQLSLLGSVALGGSGQLSLAGSPFVVGSVNLTGLGTLSLSGTSAQSGVVGLSGVGTLSLSGKVALSGPVVLSGVGVLSLQGSPHTSGVVVLTGTGVLQIVGSTTPIPDELRLLVGKPVTVWVAAPVTTVWRAGEPVTQWALGRA